MKKHLVVLISVVVLMCAGVLAAAPSNQWEFLSTTDTGASPFIKAHPQWDGRGVLIAVCDSGVDLGLPGLLRTTDGKAKIIDARVFCDEGKIDLEKAEKSNDKNGKALHGKDGKWLYGYESVIPKSVSKDDLLIGYFKESDFKNSDAEGGDLNNNGSKSDVYGIVVFKEKKDGKETWKAVIDTNADGNLADEKIVGDFSKTRKAFGLRGRDVHSDAKVMGFALNLWPEKKEAALYMADGSHGTHVSGIAAGYRLENRDAFNGVAPGAQILALKIGNNTLSGGATTAGSMVSAWRYAVKKAKELKMPLVIQMSYGIGSEQEGKSEAGKLINELLKDNPGVVATVAAGNDGPGISTVGLPACGPETLSIAAVLPRSSARDLYGVSLSHDELFYFSSRGGEINKPDVAAPGVAASTVPNYEHGDNVFMGTSMASPQAAGACAILLSAAKSSGLKVTRAIVNSAIRRGAVHIPGYGPLDEGYGLINIPRSWEILKTLASRNRNMPLEYNIETTSPEMTGGKGPAIFWRGDYYPGNGRNQIVTVKPIFPEDTNADFKARFYQAFDLQSTASWLKVKKGSVFMKAKKSATVPVGFNSSALSRPGLYQARILAYKKGYSASEKKKMGPEWSIPAAIVVPVNLRERNNFTYNHDYIGMKAGKVERLFLRIPSETASLRVSLKAPEGQRGVIIGFLFDPEGRQSGFAYTREGRTRVSLVPDEDSLVPGVWEVDLYAYYSNKRAVSMNLSATALPLIGMKDAPVKMPFKQGKTPCGKIELTSGLNDALHLRASAKITGSITEKCHKISSTTWTHSFKVAPGESGVHFRLSLSQEEWNYFTDIAVMILDSNGKALESSGMDYRFLTMDFEPPKGAGPKAGYTLKVIAAYADPDSTPTWTLHLKEVHLYSEPVKLSVKADGESGFTLYPDLSRKISLSAGGVPPALPNGADWQVEMKLTDTRRPERLFPLDFKLENEK